MESYSFEYDSLGRLIRSREEGGNGIVQKTEHIYDTANRLTKQNWTVGARSFRETYRYDSSDGNLSSLEISYDSGNSGWGFVTDKLTYTYDDLNRLTQVLDSENGTPFYTRNYQYQNLSGQRTTSRLPSSTTATPPTAAFSTVTPTPTTGMGISPRSMRSIR